MRQAGLRGVSRRRFPATTRREPTHRPANDLVDRDFRAARPNRLWVADITYLPTAAGFLFLAVVLDAGSRRIVGWTMANELRTRLVLDALDMAVTPRKPGDVVRHSDQGSQYTSVAFGMRCRGTGVRPSTGSVGDAYDNAMAEAFLAPPNASGWTAAASAPRPRPGWRCSTSSRASTTRSGVTRPWATSRPSNTKPAPWPRTNDPYPLTVHEIGATPARLRLSAAS